jgi:hypothetical protein
MVHDASRAIRILNRLDNDFSDSVQIASAMSIVQKGQGRYRTFADYDLMFGLK